MKFFSIKNALFLVGFILIGVVLVYSIQLFLKSNADSAAIASMEQKVWVTPMKGVQSPNFTLTDQNGKKISLTDFKGKVVVLQFMDPKCTDICPIVSQEIVLANQELGAKSKNAVYIAVNVNQYHESIKDVMGFSKEHGLNKLSNWHFVTGSTDKLKKVWKEYHIEVQPNPTGDVVHSSQFYFIDKSGVERYQGNPDNSKSSISRWGKGIAFFTKELM